MGRSLTELFVGTEFRRRPGGPLCFPENNDIWSDTFQEAPMVVAESQAGTSESGRTRPSAGRITELASNLDEHLNHAISRIGNLNSETKFIAINAKMEAMRAGGLAGKAFSVVAQAIQQVSKQTADVARNLAEETHETVTELRDVNEALATTVQGERLADLALVNIDLVDRNLYERTCDVRWWATDASVVEACKNPTSNSLKYASQRLGQILDAYTVYFDIVLCDLEGRIIANGRPHMYPSVGTCHGDKEWFRTAVASRSGDQFGFLGMCPSSLVGNQRVLTYSCGVRESGDPRGKLTGVLAVVFRWDALGQTIVERTPLSADEQDGARIVLIEESGRVIADTDGKFGDYLDLVEVGGVLNQPRSYGMINRPDGRYLVGHAKSPGYETYATGWHSLIFKPLR